MCTLATFCPSLNVLLPLVQKLKAIKACTDLEIPPSNLWTRHYDGEEFYNHFQGIILRSLTKVDNNSLHATYSCQIFSIADDAAIYDGNYILGPAVGPEGINTVSIWGWISKLHLVIQYFVLERNVTKLAFSQYLIIDYCRKMMQMAVMTIN